MRFVCGDVRDLVVSHKTDHGPAHWCYRALQQWRCLKICFREIFGIVRFSTFATKSASTGSRVTWRLNGSTKQPLDVKGTVPTVGNFGAGGGTVQATNARMRYLNNRVGTVVLIDIK